MMGSDRARPAYVEDVNETGQPLRETRRSAKTQNKSHRPKRPEETSRTNLRVDVNSKDMKFDPRTHDSPKKSARFPPGHEFPPYHPHMEVPGAPGRYDHPFGVPSPNYPPQPPVSLPHRPRASTSNACPRPPGNFGAMPGGYGPPPAMSAYYPQTAPLPPHGFPPQTPPFVGYQDPMAPMPPMPPQDFPFQPPMAGSRPLASRFQSMEEPVLDPIARTSSAFGIRDTPRSVYNDMFDEEGYHSVTETATVRKKKSKRKSDPRAPPVLGRDDEGDEADPGMLPPKPRQGILRRTVDFTRVHQDPSDYHESKSSFHDAARSRRPSVSYDLNHGGEGVRLEPSSSRRRRQSWYEKPTPALHHGYEAKYQQASTYVDDTTGPDSTPLTIETLRRQQKRQDGSSRSTKSSASRDESDIRKSVTTRTTRSGSPNEDENMTIKVTGSARVTVGGAQIDCAEGGAIEIKRDKISRESNDRSSPEYGDSRRAIEDHARRGPFEKPSSRSRLGSQAFRQPPAHRDFSGGDYY